MKSFQTLQKHISYSQESTIQRQILTNYWILKKITLLKFMKMMKSTTTGPCDKNVNLFVVIHAPIEWQIFGVY